MGKIYKLDSSGHGEVATWGDDAASREAGAEAFRSLAERHFTMFDITPATEDITLVDESGYERLVLRGSPLGVKLKEFDPDVAEILAVPRMEGG